MGIENNNNIIPSWMDPAFAIAAFGSNRDIDRYTQVMRSDVPLFAPEADAAYNRVPDPSILTGNSGMLINSSYSGTNYNGGFQLNMSNAGTLSPGLTGSGGLFLTNSSAGVYVKDIAPTDEKENDDNKDKDKNKDNSYAYNSFSFTLDTSGKPSFKGPEDDEHSDGKWKLEDINTKLSESDYNRLKQAVDDARKTEGLDPLYGASS